MSDEALDERDDNTAGQVEVAERVNVALITDASQALAKLQERTGLKKVDVVNRAVQLYELIDAEIREGGQVLLRAQDGELHRLRIL